MCRLQFINQKKGNSLKIDKEQGIKVTVKKKAIQVNTQQQAQGSASACMRVRGCVTD